MTYAQDLWEFAVCNHGVITVAEVQAMGIPAVELRKLAAQGVLAGFGNGVYTHKKVPKTHVTQYKLAVSLAGEGAFLLGEAVFALLQLGGFHPRRIQVGVRRRVRRALPQWMELCAQKSISDGDITNYLGVSSLRVEKALEMIADEISHSRCQKLVEQCLSKGYISSDNFQG